MEELIANLQEDYELLMKDKNPTDEEKKIAFDISKVIEALKVTNGLILRRRRMEKEM